MWHDVSLHQLGVSGSNTRRGWRTILCASVSQHSYAFSFLTAWGLETLGRNTGHWRLSPRQRYTEYPLALLTQTHAPEGQAASSVAALRDWFQCRMRLTVGKCYLFNLLPSSVGWIRRDPRSSQNSVYQCTEYLLLSPVWWLSLQSWNAHGIGTTSFPSKAEPRSSITQANMLTDPGAGTVLASIPFTLLCSCGSFSRIITCSPLCLPECLS